MLEKDIEARVCKHAQKYGVLTRKYTSPSHRSVPDRLFLFPTGLAVFIEFKQKGAKPTKGQRREMQKLVDLQHLVYVIDDIDDGCKLVDSLIEIISRDRPETLTGAAMALIKQKFKKQC